MTNKKLSGKAALVTGGSRGIGAAIARALADEGADVAISYVSSPDKAEVVVNELKGKGVRAVAFKADQADIAQVQALVQSTNQHFGQLDILVNSAGVAVGGSVDETFDQSELERQFAVNVHGVAAAVRTASGIMQEGGRIISIGSILGNRVPIKGMADYSATKAAVAVYTKGWARDLGARGITVNAVQPGPINTDMNPDDTEFATTLKGITALGRYGKPEEVAAAVVFLASPGASYITGTTLDVDGGSNA
jgi:3-oxoacyl-[acyl-carrier protein] reductase